MFHQRQDNVSFGISPTGDKIVFNSAAGRGTNLFLLTLDKHKVSAVTNDTAYKQRPSFSPDGNQIVYSASTTINDIAHLFVCASDGRNQRQIISSDSYDTSPSFSPDASQIVFACAMRKRPGSMGGWKWDQWDVFTIHSDGTNLRRITNNRYYQMSAPFWSPDGKHILFSVTQGAQVHRDVCVVDSQGAVAPVLLTNDGHSSEPSYSPDGNDILYISDVKVNFDYELWRMHNDGTAPQQITHNSAYNLVPRCLPDGRGILFLSDPGRAQRFDLWQVDFSGQNLKRVADSALFDDPLHWKPR